MSSHEDLIDELVKAELAIEAGFHAGVGPSPDQAKKLDDRRDRARTALMFAMSHGDAVQRRFNLIHQEVVTERDTLKAKLEQQTAKLREAAALVARCSNAEGPCDEGWGMLAEMLDS